MSRRVWASLLSAPVLAQQQQQNGLLTVLKFPGGTMKTDLGYGIGLNKNSSLVRVWYTINDSACPIQMTDSGVATVYQSERFAGKYLMVPKGAVASQMAVRAFDLTFALFTVWGERNQLLGYSRVLDMEQGAQHTFEGSWTTTESEVEAFRTSVAFVSRVLKEDETVWTCDYAGLSRKLAEVRIRIAAGRLSQKQLE